MREGTLKMSRRSKKISRLQKDNKFLRYVVDRARKEVDRLNVEICTLKAKE